MRPDGHKHMPASDYVTMRFLNLCVPLLSITQVHSFIPNFSPFEKTIFKITKNVFGGVSSFCNVLNYTTCLLVLSGASSVSLAEVFTVSCLLTVSTLYTQAVRERREAARIVAPLTLLRNSNSSTSILVASQHHLDQGGRERDVRLASHQVHA